MWTLLRSLSLGGIVLLVACDSHSSMEEPTLADGRWTGTAPVDWSTSFALPSWASADSISYRYVGTHSVSLNLQQGQQGQLTGTLDWDNVGQYTITEYVNGTPTVQTENSTHDSAPVQVRARANEDALVFDGQDNAWIDPLDSVTLTVEDNRASGTLYFRYFERTYTGGPNGEIFSAPLTVPVLLRLTRT